MAKQSVSRQRDRGAVAVLVGILIGFGVLLPVSALVVDVGSIYVESQELASGADAAAMVVAQGCVAGKCEAADLPAQIAKAKAQASANAKDGHTSVTEVCGNWASLPACTTPTKSNLATCVGSAPAGQYVEVRVRTEMSDGSTLLPPSLAKTFVGNETYSGTAVGNCARVKVADVCVDASKATYKHTFNGPAGQATITANERLCPGEEQVFSLVSYTAPSAVFAVPQYMYDYETKKITSTTKSLSFDIDVPDCYTQVDFVFGYPINPLTSAAYGYRKVGESGAPGNTSVGPPAWYNGGTKACNPKPTTTFTAQCDGTMDVLLANGSTANIDAVFTVTAGGVETLYRVAKGANKTVEIPASKASKVTVEDNTFKTSTQAWKKPAKCK